MTGQRLKPLFEPERVAIIGASAVPGKPGHEILRNILANAFPGKIYPVNPKGGEILGLTVTPAIEALPPGIDVAVIILPAEATPDALRACADRGIRHMVLSAGGFAEVDAPRAQLQAELQEIIRDRRLTVLGPNTSGHTSMPAAFTSTFFPMGTIRRGTVSFIAQTGNFGTHTLRYILTGEHFGICRVVGLGNKIDVDECDALAYLGDDPETKAVLIYLESFKRPRLFLEVARQVTRKKPVILLKGGATEAGRQAAVAHTAAMAASELLVDGMLRQAGVVRIRDYSHLILAAKALSMMPLPRGNRVSFLAPSGAMLVVLADLCQRIGLTVPAMRPETVRRLQEISPPYMRMRNPVDIWASANIHGTAFGYGEGMEAVLKDPEVDAVVPILMLTERTGVPPPQFIVDLARRYPHKPLYVTFSADKTYMDEYKAMLEPLGIPTFPEIERPFEVLSILNRCRHALARGSV